MKKTQNLTLYTDDTSLSWMAKENEGLEVKVLTESKLIAQK